MDPDINSKNNETNPSVPPGSSPSPMTDQPQSPQTADNLQYISTEPPKKKSRKKFWLTILAVLVLAGGAFAAWKLLDKEEPVATQAPTKKEIPLLNIGITTSELPDNSVNEKVSSYGYMVNSQIYEGLVRYESKDRLVSLLATGWSNPDDKTWVFSLKQGVTFHNGNPFTAADVKKTIDDLVKGGSEFGEVFATNIKSVEANGDYQVTIKTNTPDAVLLNKLSLIYITDAESAQDKTKNKAGTGPYTYAPEAADTSKEPSINLVAFDRYHGDRPLTRAVNFVAAKNQEELLKGFEEGKFNIVGAIPGEDVAGINANQYVVSEPEVGFFSLNTFKGPLAKKEVRQALRYAMDINKLGQAAGHKIEQRNQLIPSEIPGYNPEIQAYPYDPVKARELLKKAGYANGLTLNFAHADPDPRLSEEMVRQLKEVGITVKTKMYEDFNEFIEAFFKGQTEMSYLVYVSDTLDGVDILSSMIKDTGNYNNPKVNDLIDEAAGTIDGQERLSLLQRASKLVDEDVPFVPTFSKDSIWLMDKDYGITQDMPSTFLSAYLAKTYEK